MNEEILTFEKAIEKAVYDIVDANADMRERLIETLTELKEHCTEHIYCDDCGFDDVCPWMQDCTPARYELPDKGE